MGKVTLTPTEEVVAFYAQRCFELEAANVSLATEAERLKSGLRFYAHREHIAGFESWSEGDDPESPDWLCDDHPSGNMIETGGVARTILAGHVPNWGGTEPLEHPCEPGDASPRRLRRHQQPGAGQGGGR